MKRITGLLLHWLTLDAHQRIGFIDFILGFILIVLPWFFVDENNIYRLAIMMIMGSALILYAIFTDYRYGIFNLMLQGIRKAHALALRAIATILWPLKLAIAGLLLT